MAKLEAQMNEKNELFYEGDELDPIDAAFLQVRVADPNDLEEWIKADCTKADISFRSPHSRHHTNKSFEYIYKKHY